jgi:hypothetical protein
MWMMGYGVWASCCLGHLHEIWYLSFLMLPIIVFLFAILSAEIVMELLHYFETWYVKSSYMSSYFSLTMFNNTHRYMIINTLVALACFSLLLHDARVTGACVMAVPSMLLVCFSDALPVASRKYGARGLFLLFILGNMFLYCGLLFHWFPIKDIFYHHGDAHFFLTAVAFDCLRYCALSSNHLSIFW